MGRNRWGMALALAATAITGAASAPGAGAAVPHVVQPGETLWSIAAANNFTTRTVAAFNGLSEDAMVVEGSTIQVPTVAEGAAALAGELNRLRDCAGSACRTPFQAPAAP